MPRASQGFLKIILRLFVTVMVLFTGTSLWPQQSGNPFEIKPRLGQMPESTGPATADAPTGNPFDIIAPIPGDSSAQAQDSLLLEFKGPDVLKAPDQWEGFIIGLTLFSFLLLAVLVTLFRPYFQKVFRAIGNDNMLSQAHREYLQGQKLPYLMLYATFMVNAGIFLFLLIRRVYDFQLGNQNMISLLLCIGVIAGIFLLKHFLLFLTGRIFSVEKEVSAYNFTIIIFSIFIGIGLFAGNIFLALGTEKILFPSVIGIAIFIGLVYLLRSFRALLIGSRFIPLHIFHFLLYICTAEIAPVAVAVKLIFNQL